MSRIEPPLTCSSHHGQLAINGLTFTWCFSSLTDQSEALRQQFTFSNTFTECFILKKKKKLSWTGNSYPNIHVFGLWEIAGVARESS